MASALCAANQTQQKCARLSRGRRRARPGVGTEGMEVGKVAGGRAGLTSTPEPTPGAGTGRPPARRSNEAEGGVTDVRREAVQEEAGRGK